MMLIFLILLVLLLVLALPAMPRWSFASRDGLDSPEYEKRIHLYSSPHH